MAALVSVLMTGAVWADTHYVSAVRPDDSGDGLSWTTAEKSIQAAIDATVAGDMIIVTNGIYAPISTANKAILIQSVDGASVSIIDAGATNRCATLGSSSAHTNTVLVGFTLRNGYASSGGGSYYGTLNNCTFSGNSASSNGGGSYYGTLNNCTFSGNSASSGGGSYYGILNNCTFSENRVSFYGGGAFFGTLNNCTFSDNKASYYGGGACYSTLNNCTLTGNNGSLMGGGAYSGTLNNCTLIGNRTSSSGGGSYGGTLNNCTLTGNNAFASGGGSYNSTLNNCTLSGNSSSDGSGTSYGTLKNCIVWGNTRSYGVTNNFIGGIFSYSCTTPLPSGTGNISDDPLFKDAANSNFQVQRGSPCIDRGNNALVVGATDLAGNPRIQNGTVDMGAYEMPTVTVTFDANGGQLVTGQTSTNFVGYTGDLYASWLTISNGISRAGYIFVGWWTDDKGMGTQVTESTTVATASNHTLFAKWGANTFTLTLDAEGGTVSPGSKRVTFDTAYGDLPVPTRGGYRFTGWWTGANGTGSQVTEVTRITTASDHTLYATWTIDPYLCRLEGDAPLSSTGSYNGFFYNEGAIGGITARSVLGTLDLTVSTLAGKLTAKANVQNESLRFRSLIWTQPDSGDGVSRAVMTALGGEVLDLYMGQDRIWGSLSGGSLANEPLTLAGMRNRFADPTDVAAQTLLNNFRGYYTVALPIYSAMSLGEAEAAPEGSGYLTCTVGDQGNVTIAGELADGTRVSKSSHLILFDGCGPEACVPFFTPLYLRKGWAGGLLWFDPSKRTVFTDRDINWFVRWEKPRSFVDGFSELLDACGGFYSTSESLAAHYRFSVWRNELPYFHSQGITDIEPVFPTDINVTADGTRLIMTEGVKPLRTGDVYDYAASENSSMTTLTFQPATGIFKGGFNLYYDYTLGSVLKHKIVSVRYSGVLAPVRSGLFDNLPAGQGYYLVPESDPAFLPYRLKRSYLIELDDAE